MSDAQPPPATTMLGRVLAVGGVLATGASAAGLLGGNEWGRLAERVGLPTAAVFFSAYVALLAGRWLAENVIKPLVKTVVRFVEKVEKATEATSEAVVALKANQQEMRQEFAAHSAAEIEQFRSMSDTTRLSHDRLEAAIDRMTVAVQNGHGNGNGGGHP